MQQVLIHQSQLKCTLELDTDKLKNVRSKLRNLKTKVEKLNIDKLITVPGNISKLRDVVKNNVKKDVYSAKIENIKIK